MMTSYITKLTDLASGPLPLPCHPPSPHTHVTAKRSDFSSCASLLFARFSSFFFYLPFTIPFHVPFLNFPSISLLLHFNPNPAPSHRIPPSPSPLSFLPLPIFFLLPPPRSEAAAPRGLRYVAAATKRAALCKGRVPHCGYGSYVAVRPASRSPSAARARSRRACTHYYFISRTQAPETTLSHLRHQINTQTRTYMHANDQTKPTSTNK